MDPRLTGARLRSRFFKMDLGFDSWEFGHRSMDRDSGSFSRDEVDPFFFPFITSWFPHASNNRDPLAFLMPADMISPVGRGKSFV